MTAAPASNASLARFRTPALIGLAVLALSFGIVAVIKHFEARAHAATLRFAIFNARYALDVMESHFFSDEESDEISFDPRFAGSFILEEDEQKPKDPRLPAILPYFEMPLLDTKLSLRDLAEREMGLCDEGMAPFPLDPLSQCLDVDDSALVMSIDMIRSYLQDGYDPLSSRRLGIAELDGGSLFAIQFRNSMWCGSGGCTNGVFVFDTTQQRIVVYQDADYIVDLRAKELGNAERLAFVKRSQSGAYNWQTTSTVYARDQHSLFSPIVETTSRSINWIWLEDDD